jgi:3-oxoadipate enol-lactonase
MNGALLFVITSPDPTISEERYQNWYDNEHLPARLTVPGISSALRFKAKGEKKWLGYYDMDSPDVLKSKEYSVLKEKASENERSLITKINMDRRVYKLIYSIGSQAASPPKTLLAVEMTPYPTHEKEFHHWYDTYHIPQMADVPGWSRSRRFELIEPLNSGVCKYLTLHEFDRLDALGSDRVGNVKWRNEVIEIVTERDRQIWEPYHASNEPSGIHIVNHGGIQFNVKVEGKEDGPVIAFSNPLGLDLTVWDNVVAALSPKYRLIRHDQRGHGHTSQPTKPITFSDLTDDIVAILDYLKVPKLHAFVGISMGGIVALDFGSRFPERVCRIIPCDGQPYSTPDNKGQWDARVALIRTKGFGYLAEQSANRWFTARWKDNPENKTKHNAVRELFLKTSPNGYIMNAHAFEDYNYLEEGKSLKVPCYLICGAQDPPLATMKDLEEVIPEGRLAVIENCGHLPMIEQPEAFIEVLKTLL